MTVNNVPVHDNYTRAVEADGDSRDGADVAELTALLPDLAAAGWPAGTRVVVRRERPHPGAQLTFIDVDGWCFQAFATDTPVGQLAHLEARHRAHARVEDRIRCGKDTGFGRFPSRWFPINQVWLELALTAVDLLAWTQSMLVDREPAGCPCATGCSTSPPDSPADNAAATSASPNTGAGPASSSPPSAPASTSRPGAVWLIHATPPDGPRPRKPETLAARQHFGISLRKTTPSHLS